MYKLSTNLEKIMVRDRLCGHQLMVKITIVAMFFQARIGPHPPTNFDQNHENDTETIDPIRNFPPHQNDSMADKDNSAHKSKFDILRVKKLVSIQDTLKLQHPGISRINTPYSGGEMQLSILKGTCSSQRVFASTNGHYVPRSRICE